MEDEQAIFFKHAAASNLPVGGATCRLGQVLFNGGSTKKLASPFGNCKGTALAQWMVLAKLLAWLYFHISGTTESEYVRLFC